MADKNKDVTLSMSDIKKAEDQINLMSQKIQEDINNGTTQTEYSAQSKTRNGAVSVKATSIEKLEGNLRKISGQFQKIKADQKNINNSSSSEAKHFEMIVDEFGKTVSSMIEGQKKSTSMLDVENGRSVSRPAQEVTKFDSSTGKFSKEINAIPHKMSSKLKELKGATEAKQKNLEATIRSQLQSYQNYNETLDFIQNGIGTTGHSGFSLKVDPNNFVKQIDRELAQKVKSQKFESKIPKINLTKGSKIALNSYNAKQIDLSKNVNEALKNIAFFDFESVGNMEESSFSPTQFSARYIKDGQKKYVEKILQLSKDSQAYLAKAIKDAQAGIDLTDDQRRSILELTSYTKGVDKNGKNVIVAKHKDWSYDTKIKDVLGQAIQGFNLLSGEDSSISNLSSMKEVTEIASMLKKQGYTLSAHNGEGFDTRVPGMEKFKTELFDTMQFMKEYFSFGDKNKTTGKSLQGYSLSALSDFFKIDLKELEKRTGLTQHTATFDNELSNEILKSAVQYIKNNNLQSRYHGLETTQLKKGDVALSLKNYWRKNSGSFKSNANGIVMGADHSGFGNKLIKENLSYMFQGAKSTDIGNYLVLKALETGEEVSLKYDSEREAETLLNDIFGGNFKSGSEISQKDIQSRAMQSLFDVGGSYKIREIAKLINGGQSKSSSANYIYSNFLQGGDTRSDKLRNLIVELDKNLGNDLYNENGKNDLLLRQFGEQFGKKSGFSINDIKRYVELRSGAKYGDGKTTQRTNGDLVKAAEAIRQYMTENRDMFLSDNDVNEILQHLQNKIGGMSAEDYARGKDSFYDVYSMIYDRLDPSKMGVIDEHSATAFIDNIVGSDQEKSINTKVTAKIQEIKGNLDKQFVGAGEMMKKFLAQTTERIKKSLTEDTLKQRLNSFGLSDEDLKNSGLGRFNGSSAVDEKTGFKFGSIAKKLQDMITTVAQNGIGVHMWEDIDNNAIKLGFYNKDSESAIFKPGGEIDKSLMSMFEVPLSTVEGQISNDGMTMIDKIVADKKDGMSVLQTSSERIMEMLFNTVNSKSFVESLTGKREFDKKRIENYFKKRKNEELSGLATSSTYKSDSVIQEIASGHKGGTKEQNLMRSSTVSLGPWIEKTLKETYGFSDEEIKADNKIQKLFSYLNLEMGGASDAVKADKSWDWIRKGIGQDAFQNILNEYQQYQKVAKFNIRGTKEQAYGNQEYSSYTMEDFVPFLELGAAEYRAYNQAANYLKKTGAGTGGKENPFSSELAELHDLPMVKGLESKQFNIGDVSDFDIQKSLKTIREKLKTGEDAPGIKELKQFLAKHFNRDFSKMSNNDFLHDFNKYIGRSDPNVSLDMAILNKKYAKDLESEEDYEVKLTENELQSFLSNIGYDLDLNKIDENNLFKVDSSIGVLKDGINVSGKKYTPDNFKLDSILKLANGKYKLKGKSTVQDLQRKIITSTGHKHASSIALDPEVFNALAFHAGFQQNGELIKDLAMLQETSGKQTDSAYRSNKEIGFRKAGGELLGEWSYLFSEAFKDGKSAEEIFKAFQGTAAKDYLRLENNTFLKNTRTNLNTGVLEYKNSESGNWEQLPKEMLEALYSGNAFRSVAKQLYGLDDKGFEASKFGKNISSAGLLMFNDAQYFDATGSGKDVEAQSRYHLGPKEIDAMKRKINLVQNKMVDSKYRLSEDEAKDMNSYMGEYFDGVKEENKDRERTNRYLENINKASEETIRVNSANSQEEYDGLLSSISDNLIVIKRGAVDLTSLKDNEMALSQIIGSDFSGSEEDFQATLMGKVRQKAKELGYDLSKTRLQFDYRNASGESELRAAVKAGNNNGYKFDREINSLIVPLSEQMAGANGELMYNELESGISKVARALYNGEDPTAVTNAYLDKAWNLANNKDSSLVKAAQRHAKGNAIVGKAGAHGIYQEGLDGFAVLNPEQMKEMLRSDGSKEIQDHNIENLMKQLAYLNELKNGGKFVVNGKDINSFDEFSQIMSGDLKGADLENSLIDEIIKYIDIDADPNNALGLYGLTNRFPSLNALDLQYSKLAVSKHVNKGHIKTSFGMQKLMNGDADGDTTYAGIFNQWIKGDSYDSFKNRQGSFEKLAQLDADVMAAIQDRYLEEYQNEIAQEVQGGNVREESGKQVLSSWLNSKDALKVAIGAKDNFKLVGTFSNFSTIYRNILKNSGLDEINKELSPENLVGTMLTRSIFEMFEQDAISSKKLASRYDVAGGTKEKAIERLIAKGYSKDDIGQDEVFDEIYTSLSKFSKMISSGKDKNGNYYNTRSKEDEMRRWNDLLTYGQEIGIFGSDEQFLKGRQSDIAMERIVKTLGLEGETGRAKVKELFGNNADLAQNEKTGKWHVTGSVSKENLLKGIQQLEESSYQMGQGFLFSHHWDTRESLGLNRADSDGGTTKSGFKRFSDLYKGAAHSGMDALQKEDTTVSDSNKIWDEHGNFVADAATSENLKAQASMALVEALGKENSAFANLNGIISQHASEVEQAKKKDEELKKQMEETIATKGFGESDSLYKKVGQDKQISSTKLNAMQMGIDNKSLESLKGKDLLGIINGTGDQSYKDLAQKYLDSFVATGEGTFAHSIFEALNKGETFDVNQINKILSNAGLSSQEDIDYVKEKILGKYGDNIKSFDDLGNAYKGAYEAYKQSHPSEFGDGVHQRSELALYSQIGKKQGEEGISDDYVLKTIIDTLKYVPGANGEKGTIEIGDYKTGVLHQEQLSMQLAAEFLNVLSNKDAVIKALNLDGILKPEDITADMIKLVGQQFAIDSKGVGQWRTIEARTTEDEARKAVYARATNNDNQSISTKFNILDWSTKSESGNFGDAETRAREELINTAVKRIKEKDKLASSLLKVDVNQDEIGEEFGDSYAGLTPKEYIEQSQKRIAEIDKELATYDQSIIDEANKQVGIGKTNNEINDALSDLVGKVGVADAQKFISNLLRTNIGNSAFSDAIKQQIESRNAGKVEENKIIEAEEEEKLLREAYKKIGKDSSDIDAYKEMAEAEEGYGKFSEQNVKLKLAAFQKVIGEIFDNFLTNYINQTIKDTENSLSNIEISDEEVTGSIKSLITQLAKDNPLLQKMLFDENGEFTEVGQNIISGVQSSSKTTIENSTKSINDSRAKARSKNLIEDYKKAQAEAFILQEDLLKLQEKQSKATFGKDAYVDPIRRAKEALAEQQRKYRYNEETGELYVEGYKVETLKGSQKRAFERTNSEAISRQNRKINDVYGAKPGKISQFLNQMESQMDYYLGTGLAYNAVGKIMNAFTSGIQQIKEFDKTMVDLQVVSGKTRSEVKNLIKDYNSYAKELGATTQEVASAANEFMRMGYNAETSSKLIKDAMMLSKLGMIESAQATEYLISAIKGYNVAIEDSTKIVDMATGLDMKYAVSAGYILEAMSRTAASAKLAGVEMSDLQSIIAVTGETTQKDAAVIGESLKTAFARYGNLKSSAFLSADLDVENMDNAEEYTKVNDIEKVLVKQGISVRESDMKTWRSYSDILDELGKKWNTYSDYEKNAITTAMFGTRQRENGIVMLENYNRVLEAQKVAISSVGTSEKKMEAYNNGLEAATNRVTAAWEGFVQSLSANGVLKFFSQTLAEIIGNLKTILIVGGAIYATFKAGSLIETIGSFSNNFANKAFQAKSLIGSVGSGEFKSNLKKQFQSSIERNREQAKNFEHMRNGEKPDFNPENSDMTPEEQANYEASNSNTDATRENTNAVNGLSDTIRATYGAATTGNTSVETTRVNGLKLKSTDSDKIRQIKSNFENEKSDLRKKIGETNKRIRVENGLPNRKDNTITRHNRVISTQIKNGDINPRNVVFDEKNGIYYVKNKNRKYSLKKQNNFKYKNNNESPNNNNNNSNNSNPKKTSVGNSKLSGTAFGNFLDTTGSITGMIGGGVLGSNIATAVGGNSSTGAMIGSMGGMVLTQGLSMIPGVGPIVSAATGLGLAVGGAIVNGIKKAREKALRELQDDLAEIEENLSSANSSKDKVYRYDELANGVDNLGRNISLTDDEYQEFLSLGNELAEVYPTLIQGTDGFGNSLLGVENNLDGVGYKIGNLTQQIPNLIKEMEHSQFEKMFETSHGTSIFEESINGLKKVEEEYKKLETDLNISKTENKGNANIISPDKGSYSELIYGDMYVEDIKNGNSVLSDLNLNPEESQKFLKYLEGNGIKLKDDVILDLEKNDFDEFLKIAKGYFNGPSYSDETLKFNKQTRERQKEIDKFISDYLPAMIYHSGEEINDKQKGVVSNVLRNMKFNVKGQTDTQENLLNYTDNLISSLANSQVQNALEQLYGVDMYSGTLTEYENNVKKARDTVAKNVDDEVVQAMAKNYGYEDVENLTDDQKDEIINRMVTGTQKEETGITTEALVEKVGNGINKDDVANLTVNQARALYEMSDDEVESILKDYDDIANGFKNLVDVLNENSVTSISDMVSTVTAALKRLNKEVSDIVDSDGNIDESKLNDQNLTDEVKLRIQELQEMAKNYGVTVGYILENPSQFAGIDKNGFSTRTIEQVQKQYSDYNSIIDDLSQDGKLSAENYNTVMKDSDLAYQLSLGEDKLEEYLFKALENKTNQYIASISGQLQQNPEWFKQYKQTNGLVGEGWNAFSSAKTLSDEVDKYKNIITDITAIKNKWAKENNLDKFDEDKFKEQWGIDFDTWYKLLQEVIDNKTVESINKEVGINAKLIVDNIDDNIAQQQIKTAIENLTTKANDLQTINVGLDVFAQKGFMTSDVFEKLTDEDYLKIIGSGNGTGDFNNDAKVVFAEKLRQSALDKLESGAKDAARKKDVDELNGYLTLLNNFDNVDWDGTKQLKKDAEKELRSLRRSEEDLITQREEYEKAKKDYDKQVKKLDDTERLNALNNLISKQNLVRDGFANMIDTMSTVIGLMGNENLTFNFDLLNSQLDLTAQKTETLKGYYQELSEITPQSADEANALSSAMQENSKQIIAEMTNLQNLKKQQRELLLTDVENTYNNTTKVAGWQNNAINRLVSRVGNRNDLFNSTYYNAGFNISDLSRAKDNVERQKEENEKILKLNEQFQKDNQKMQQTYLDLLAEEQAKDMEESREDNDRTLKNAERNMQRAEEDFKDMCDQFDEKYSTVMSRLGTGTVTTFDLIKKNGTDSLQAIIDKVKDLKDIVESVPQDASTENLNEHGIDTTKFSQDNPYRIGKAATIYMESKSSPDSGHVGIYDGYGGIYSNEGGKITHKKLEDMLNSGNYTFSSWGYNGGSEPTEEEANKIINTIQEGTIKAVDGYCQAWVADVYHKATGLARQSAATAKIAGEAWGKNTKIVENTMNPYEKPIFGYAHGTHYHDGGPAIVGDEGIGKYEAVVYPNGNMNIYGRNGAELINLPRGSQVIPYDKTRDLLHGDVNDVPKYADGTNYLGYIAAEYEAGGMNPGKISSGIGDKGGVSYGMPQFSTNTGSAKEFAEWLVANYPWAQALKGKTPNTIAFNNAWKEIANNNAAEFADVQQKYVWNNVAEPLAKKINDEFGIDMNRSRALQEMLFARATQQGNQTLTTFKKAGITSNMSDEEIIARYYKELGTNVSTYFKSSPSLWGGLKNRFLGNNGEAVKLLEILGLSPETILNRSNVKWEDVVNDVKKALSLDNLFKGIDIDALFNSGDIEIIPAILEAFEKGGEVSADTIKNAIVNATKDSAKDVQKVSTLINDNFETELTDLQLEFSKSMIDFNNSSEAKSLIFKSKYGEDATARGAASINYTRKIFERTVQEKMQENELYTKYINEVIPLEKESLLQQGASTEEIRKLDELTQNYLNAINDNVEESNNLQQNVIDAIVTSSDNTLKELSNIVERLDENINLGYITSIADISQQYSHIANEAKDTVDSLIADRKERERQLLEQGYEQKDFYTDDAWSKISANIQAAITDLKNAQKASADTQISEYTNRENIAELSRPNEWNAIRPIERYYNQKISNINSQIQIWKDYLDTAKNLSRQEQQSIIDTIHELEKSRKDAMISQVNDRIDYRNKQYEALKYQVNEYIDMINTEKEEVSERYDKEIEKLQKVNESKERSIKLTELQQNLENAQKEKKRVYRTGVGFVYESDRNEVKKAQQELDAFYRQDRITDLQNAKDAELKVLDERINGWNKYLKGIEKIYNTAEREKNQQILKDLLGVTTLEEMNQKLFDDRDGFLIRYKDGFKDYVGAFTGMLNELTSDFKLLQDLSNASLNLPAFDIKTSSGEKLSQDWRTFRSKFGIEDFSEIIESGKTDGQLRAEYGVSMAQLQEYRNQKSKEMWGNISHYGLDQIQEAINNKDHVLSQAFTQKELQQMLGMGMSQINKTKGKVDDSDILRILANPEENKTNLNAEDLKKLLTDQNKVVEYIIQNIPDISQEMQDKNSAFSKEELEEARQTKMIRMHNVWDEMQEIIPEILYGTRVNDTGLSERDLRYMLQTFGGEENREEDDLKYAKSMSPLLSLFSNPKTTGIMAVGTMSAAIAQGVGEYIKGKGKQNNTQNIVDENSIRNYNNSESSMQNVKSNSIFENNGISMTIGNVYLQGIQKVGDFFKGILSCADKNVGKTNKSSSYSK